MKISEKNMKIYRLATSKNAPSLRIIGKQFGMSKQRVSAIIRQVQRAIGEPVVGIEQQARFPVTVSGFYSTPEQKAAITSFPGKTRSDKLRNIIMFWGANKDRYPETRTPQMGAVAEFVGGVRVTEEQSKILATVPRATHSERMRYLITFFIKNY